MKNLISFRALLHREVIRFIKVFQQTIFSPIISSLLYFAVFGVSLGSQIHSIGTNSYASFIIPGVIIMNMMMASYSNTSASLFLSKYLHLLDNVLIAPVSYTELVMAYLLSGVFRGLLVGALIWVVGLFFAPVGIAHPGMLLFYAFSISLVFSSLGLLVGLFSNEWEDEAIVNNYFITPLTFLGGVFYSVKMLPPVVHILTKMNPLFYMVDGFRWSMLGYSESNLMVSFLITLLSAIFFFLLNVFCFAKGYKLKQ